jgi:beta-glucanase (GH16 family)
MPTDIVNDYSGYDLVWSDEFDVPGKPALANWGYESGYVRNNEAQFYSDSEENSAVKDGTLVITARKNHNGYPYTSASLQTSGKHAFMFGRFEIRARIPTSNGCWPAIWTVGNKFDWPVGGEIDIMEFYDHSILANAAWSDNKQWTAVWDSKKMPITNWIEVDPQWTDKYHVWRMDWDYDAINLYLDGELLNTINLNETFNKGWQGNFDNPFRPQGSDFGQFFILNLALGGNNGGTIDDSAFPVEYKIDFIRAYQIIK